MTFCLGVKTHDGLVGIADSRVLSGNEFITARKVSIHRCDHGALFVMTSGLRSVRDKTILYFEAALREADPSFDQLFKAVNELAVQLRCVIAEDGPSLHESGLPMNFHALVGGQLRSDTEHKLFLVYPEGNWVEIGNETPYHIIGATGYGTPVLKRAVKYEDDMRHAFKVGCLAFDSTRLSAADVDFPMDVALYARDSFQLIEHRYEHDDLRDISDWWQEQIRGSVQKLPSEWLERAFSKLTPPANQASR